MAATAAVVREHVLGSDARIAVAFAAAALALAAVVVGMYFAPAVDWFPTYAALLVGAGAVGVSLAVTNAYLNRGVVATVLLAWSGLLPFWVPYAFTDAPIGRELTAASAVATLLWGPAIPAVVVGLLAYVVGVGVHRPQVRAAG